MEYEIDYLFNELTGGKSDFLNEVSLHQALKAANIHMDRAEVKKIIETYDQDGNGKVDKIEFWHFMMELMKKELIE